MTGRYEIETREGQRVYIVCPFCQHQEINSIGEYWRHYRDSHMGLHGLASPADLKSQTTKWRNEAITREALKTGDPAIFHVGMMGNRPLGYLKWLD